MTDQLAPLRDALADRYRIERPVGAGGFATVHLAHDLRHDRKVALKVLRPDLAATLGADRFLREVAITAALTHPHIVPVFDSGTAAGHLFYVMPYLEGPSLRQRLEQSGELPVDEAVRLLDEVADALAHAHAAGIVHRDLKPENVMLAGEHALVADFGVAKAVAAAGGGTALTSIGMAVGTPAYMAPEQASADPQVDHRADLYALGILAYELLTGAPPFQGGNAQQLVFAHLTRTPDPVADRRPAVPARLSALVMRCLEKRAADRWQTAAEVRRELQALRHGSGETAPVRRAAAAGSLVLTEALCRKLDRASFDPRMIGDQLFYLDNQVPSDVLVLMIADWAIAGLDPTRLLPDAPYRVVVPTLYGLERERRPRIPIPITDHLTLLEALLRDLAARTGARTVLVVGFSAAGDLALRLAAASAPDTPLHGCLALGPNVGLETCNVSGTLAAVTSNTPAQILGAVNASLAGAESVEDWLNLAEDFRDIVSSFRGDFRPIQRFTQDIVAPFRERGLDALIGWYRDATTAGRLVRCVFEDHEVYNRRLRELHLRNIDEGVLGPAYRPGSFTVEPVTAHFALREQALILRHLEGMLQELRTQA